MTESDGATTAYRVGDIEIVTVADGRRSFDLPDGFVRNAGRAEINAALAAAGMPPDRMTIVFNPIVIRTAGRTILVDSGNGAAAAGQSADGPGLLMRNLGAAGIAPDAIDLVIISHFHGDHINGLLLPDGGPAFPNAAITVPEREWAFWMDDGEMARAPAGRMSELFANVRRVLPPLRERIEQHGWGRAVAPGIEAVGTPGHTPGHTSYLVSSGADSLFVQSDVTNHPALFVRHPGWHPAFDQDPVMAEATRRRVYDMLAAEKMPVQGFHYPLPGRAFIEKTGDGYDYHLIEP